MEHYSVNVGFIDVRFMCGNGKGFNVAQGIKQFISAARAITNDFCLFPLGGQDKIFASQQMYLTQRKEFKNTFVSGFQLITSMC
jgi:hypothetical protein